MHCAATLWLLQLWCSRAADSPGWRTVQRRVPAERVTAASRLPQVPVPSSRVQQRLGSCRCLASTDARRCSCFLASSCQILPTKCRLLLVTEPLLLPAARQAAAAGVADPSPAARQTRAAGAVAAAAAVGEAEAAATATRRRRVVLAQRRRACSAPPRASLASAAAQARRGELGWLARWQGGLFSRDPSCPLAPLHSDIRQPQQPLAPLMR
mmetsp:Transcript_650/g.1765  ORF Transcript_650/g.1765 Transcript_650/m.1765 type:complete len:211 (-) Transcript_650:42-674(-)